MPLQTSGPITINDIATEFGGSTPHSLSEYYPGGSIVPSGVSGIYGAVPSSGPLSLYSFYGAGASDTYWKYVSLLLHNDGPNNSKNNTVVDSSGNAITVTKYTDVAQGTYTPFGDSWSVQFDGGNPLQLPGNTQDLNFGSGDFTIECWAFPTHTSEGTIAYFGGDGNSYAGVRLGINNGRIYLLMASSSGIWAINTGLISPDTAVGTWVHFAVTRSGNTIKVFVNGTQAGPDYTFTGAIYYAGQYNYVGAIQYYGYNEQFRGHISNLRVLKGTALYTSNFTPPTAPLTAITNTKLLMCNSNNFTKDSSAGNLMIEYAGAGGPVMSSRFSPFNGPSAYSTAGVGGAMHFPNTPQSGNNYYYSYPHYITANNANINLGSAGAYTIETWFYLFADAAESWPSETMPLFTWYNSFADRWGLTVNSGPTYGTGLQVWTDGPASGYFAPAIIHKYTWYHAALVWDGTISRLFLNGTFIGAVATNYARNISALYIGKTPYEYGGYIGDVAGFTGYMSNHRIVRGSALYTSSFTPPTAPLTAVANTQLLLNYNTNVIDHASSEHNYFLTINNAQLSTAQQKFGGSSLYLDGHLSNSWIQTTPHYSININNRLPSRSFKNNDFTIEAWIYIVQDSLTNNSGEKCAAIITCIGAGYQFLSWEFTVGGDGSTTGTYLDFTAWRSGSTKNVRGYPNTPISKNTWHHVAVTQNAGTARVFLNGELLLSGTSTGWGSLWPVESQEPIRVGRANVYGYLHEFLGYIDDLRISNGIARYTSNFSIPTAAFLNR